MHELSIAQSILSIAESAVPEDTADVVTSVALNIGELSGIEIDSLEFAFSVIKENTLLKHARLDIHLVKGEAECSECHTVFPLPAFGVACPLCSGYSMKILKGKELQVLNIGMGAL